MNRSAGLLVVVVLCACNSGKDDNQPPKEQVTLPDKPDLTTKAVAEKFSDGVWSVEGLLRHSAERANEKVKVRGIIKEVSVCKVDVPCKAEPHVVLVDDPKKPKRGLIVMDEIPEVDLVAKYAVGSTQLIEGKVAMWSSSGRTINLDGIVIVEPPPPADAAAAPAVAK